MVISYDADGGFPLLRHELKARCRGRRFAGALLTMKTRRHFLAGLTTAAAATWTQSIYAAPDPKKDVVIGHGSHRYKVNKA